MVIEVKGKDAEEVARFLAPRDWLERLERECVRWGIPRSRVIVDAVTRCAFGPKGLATMYSSRLRTQAPLERALAPEDRDAESPARKK